MGMTIDEHIAQLVRVKHYAAPRHYKTLDTAIETMRKYQKIEDIYYHQSGMALENSLRAVLEDGKID